MKSFVAAGLVAAVAAYPQASSDGGCASSADGTFAITTVNATQSATRRSIERRQLDGTLKLSLEDGKLTDQAGRTGYIAANYQYVLHNICIHSIDTNVPSGSSSMLLSKRVPASLQASVSAATDPCP